MVMTVMSMLPRKTVRKAPMTIHIKSRMEMMTLWNWNWKQCASCWTKGRRGMCKTRKRESTMDEHLLLVRKWQRNMD